MSDFENNLTPAIPEKPKEASYSGDEGLAPDEHRAPGSRGRESLEEKQLEMARLRATSNDEVRLAKGRRGRGNPNFEKGVAPYTVNRQKFQAWLEDHPDYQRKSGYKVAEVVRMFLYETPMAKNKEQKTRLQMLLESLFRTALHEKSKLQVAAALALLNRAFGKEQASDADLAAIKKGGLTVVYVDREKLDPEIPVVESKEQASLPAPEFIDAEVVDEDSHGK